MSQFLRRASIRAVFLTGLPTETVVAGILDRFRIHASRTHVVDDMFSGKSIFKTYDSGVCLGSFSR